MVRSTADVEYGAWKAAFSGEGVGVKWWIELLGICFLLLGICFLSEVIEGAFMG